MQLFFDILTSDVLVWDLDGTLYRSDEFALDTYNYYVNYLAKNLNIKTTFAKKMIENKVAETGSWSKAVSVLTGINEIKICLAFEKSIDKKVYVVYNKDIEQKFKVISSVFRNVLLTNGTIVNGRKVLRKMKIHPYFESIFGLDSLGILKPEKETFLGVVRFTGQEERRHLVIGDSVHSDYMGACSVGMKAIVLYNRQHRYIDLPGILWRLYLASILKIFVNRLLGKYSSDKLKKFG